MSSEGDKVPEHENRHHRRRHRRPVGRPASAESRARRPCLRAVAAIGEIGAGIQISPNASRLLIRLGLKPALDASACGRSPFISGAGTMAAPCSARRSGRKSRRPSARPTIISIAATLPSFWAPPCRPSACIRPQAGRPGAEGRACRGALRERRRGRIGPAGRRRRHPFPCAPSRLRPGEAALHRLRRLARAGAGRAQSASLDRSRLAQLDGAGWPCRALLGRGRAADERGVRRRAHAPGRRNCGPTRGTWPRCWRATTAGTRSCTT